MEIKVEDLVITRWSKAKILKNRVLKVLSKNMHKVHVVDTKGIHYDYDSYRLMTLSENETYLKQEVERASIYLDKCKQRLKDFQEQSKTVASHFPKI